MDPGVGLPVVSRVVNIPQSTRGVDGDGVPETRRGEMLKGLGLFSLERPRWPGPGPHDDRTVAASRLDAMETPFRSGGSWQPAQRRRATTVKFTRLVVPSAGLSSGRYGWRW